MRECFRRTRLPDDDLNEAIEQFLKWRKHCLESEKIFAITKLDENLMTKVFKALPGLKGLVICDTVFHLGAKDGNYDFQDLFGYEVQLTNVFSMCGEQTLPVLMRALALSQIQLETFKIGSLNSRELRGVRDPSFSLISDPYLPYMDNDASESWYISLKAINLAFVDLEASKLRHTFQELRNLDIEDLLLWTDASIQRDLKVQTMLPLLTCYCPWNVSRADPSNSIGSCPKLRYLSLKHLRVQPTLAEIMPVFELHSRTLIDVNIAGVDIIQPKDHPKSWPTMYSQLYKLRWGNLIAFHMCLSWNKRHAANFAAYLKQ